MNKGKGLPFYCYGQWQQYWQRQWLCMKCYDTRNVFSVSSQSNTSWWHFSACWQSSVWWWLMMLLSMMTILSSHCHDTSQLDDTLAQVRRRCPRHPQSPRQVPHFCLREHPWGNFQETMSMLDKLWTSSLQVESVAALEEIISDPDSMRMQVLQEDGIELNERCHHRIISRPCWYEREFWDQRTQTPATTSGIGALSMPTWATSSVALHCGCKTTILLLWVKISVWQTPWLHWWFLCRYALDMQQKILEPLSPMTQSSLLSFAELFSFMMSEGGRSRGQVRSFWQDEDFITI